jgi:uncharacterized protein (UPF0548 family)
MELSGIYLGRRSPAELERLLRAAEQAEHNYGHVGSTIGDQAPPRVPDRRFELITDGTAASALRALRAWAPHRGINGRVVPDGAPIELGATVVVVVSPFLVEMAVPNRIVAVIDEADRTGFAYGTLEGHAEAGEELFLAESLDDGRVRLSVRIQARPITWAARLASPLVSLLQRLAARRYLRAWAAAISEETS